MHLAEKYPNDLLGREHEYSAGMTVILLVAAAVYKGLFQKQGIFEDTIKFKPTDH